MKTDIDNLIAKIRAENNMHFDIQEPFDYDGYYKNLRPKWMREKRYKRLLGRLVCLYRMRDEPDNTPPGVKVSLLAIAEYRSTMLWICYDGEKLVKTCKG